jgi:hypothetical protein
MIFRLNAVVALRLGLFLDSRRLRELIGWPHIKSRQLLGGCVRCATLMSLGTLVVMHLRGLSSALVWSVAGFNASWVAQAAAGP